jgi:hypothetical protein
MAKIRIYKTVVNPMVVHEWCKTWVLTKNRDKTGSLREEDDKENI